MFPCHYSCLLMCKINKLISKSYNKGIFNFPWYSKFIFNPPLFNVHINIQRAVLLILFKWWLSIFDILLIVRQLFHKTGMTELNNANDAVTCVILRAHLRQNAVSFASNHSAMCIKLRGILPKTSVKILWETRKTILL